MKIPESPPEAGIEFNTAKKFNRYLEIQGMTTRGLDDRSYVHWDKLKRLKPPGDLSHQEWWYLLKIGRTRNGVEIPLSDKKKTPFWYSLPETIQEALHEIDKGAGGRIELPEPITNADTRDRYVVNSLIEEAITSSQIEGAATTREVAKEMIRQGRKPRDTSEQMILNNYETMREIRELRHQPLTPELVLHLHQLVTEKTLEKPEAAGRFRHTDEPVQVVSGEGEIYHCPPSADTLSDRMDAMCEFANAVHTERFIHPALRAIILHFWLAYDHPFVDGNGRTARALFYWCMLRNGYWLFEFISISSVIKESPVKYIRSFLYTETDDNDLTYFLLDEIRVIQKGLDRLVKYIERKTEEVRSLESHLKGVRSMNHRQVALLQHALKHPGQRYTVSSHQRSHGISNQTSRTDLVKLVDLGLLQQVSVGNKQTFYPESDLSEKLLDL
jgi:Fic family protein